METAKSADASIRKTQTASLRKSDFFAGQIQTAMMSENIFAVKYTLIYVIHSETFLILFSVFYRKK